MSAFGERAIRRSGVRSLPETKSHISNCSGCKKGQVLSGSARVRIDRMQDIVVQPLEGKVALVTGASSGLGEHFSRVLHTAGATVVVAARRTSRLDALEQELGPEHVHAVTCDVGSTSERNEMMDAIERRYGRLDILVNNAGISAPGPAEEETIETWTNVININLTAAFAVCQQAGRIMLRQGSGSIINIASILGLVASAPLSQASYTASKGGLINLTRELACQWARRGVRVNAIAPGWFRSEMTEAGIFQDERALAFVNRNCPMNRPGDLNELNGALLLLAGDGSSYITGQILAVDGGWTSR